MKPIGYYFLPKEIKKAFELLAKEGGVVDGVWGHDIFNCPLAKTYYIHAARWDRLEESARNRLRQLGWVRIVYDSFIDWYDDHSLMFPRCYRENLLNKFLISARSTKV